MSDIVEFFEYTFSNNVPHHGHLSSSFIVKYNDNKFMRGTSYSAEAELDSCK